MLVCYVEFIIHPNSKHEYTKYLSSVIFISKVVILSSCCVSLKLVFYSSSAEIRMFINWISLYNNSEIKRVGILPVGKYATLISRGTSTLLGSVMV